MKTAILVIERPDSGNISVTMFADNERIKAADHFAKIARENGINETDIYHGLDAGYLEQGTWELYLTHV
jgi:hypothetical protein